MLPPLFSHKSPQQRPVGISAILPDSVSGIGKALQLSDSGGEVCKNGFSAYRWRDWIVISADHQCRAGDAMQVCTKVKSIC